MLFLVCVHILCNFHIEKDMQDIHPAETFILVIFPSEKNERIREKLISIFVFMAFAHFRLYAYSEKDKCK